ncbi:MAG: hypothetical protein GWM92_11715 [Gemmatimonadetes bacterium]|nr:hypothetical protein [Gemmatimonadota bacterium]NIR78258.1 hypothetical protein [Gemmatimonadota bacterium]NIT88024.1 hypothetical protein [Gemmatimonadota bacterium]NIU30708.1 hypothetical protein [Gemmatimonadota bacterium]NIU35505.1 hypothetical protein [Gemmatimonadota bacterium]
MRRRATVGAGSAAAVALMAGVGCADAPPGTGERREAPEAPTGLSIRSDSALLARSRQHVLVIVDGPRAVKGRLVRMEGGGGAWAAAGAPVPVVVGRGGVGPKREGDGRSPGGVYPIGGAFGYGAEAPGGLTIPYRALSPGTVCVDDPGSAFYNRMVDPDTLSPPPDWESAEPMRRDLSHGDDLYRWGVEIGYNPEGEAGAGSCIFFHVWRGPDSPTVGCTAMDAADLLALARWLDPRAEPAVVQGTREELEELRGRGVLPYPLPGAGETPR